MARLHVATTSTPPPVKAATAPPRAGTVRVLPFVGGDEALCEGLRARQPAAMAALCDRYSRMVLRLLGRVLGADDELADLHHDVFVRALRAAHTVRQPSSLQGWLGTIAINVARARLKERARRRWLQLLPGDDAPEAEAPQPNSEATEALRRTYLVLDRLPREERIAFALRTIEGLKLEEVAVACDVSLATAKRRLARAEQRFLELCRADPVLRDWVGGGSS